MKIQETLVSFASSIKITATQRVGLDVIVEKIKNDVSIKNIVESIRAAQTDEDRRRLKTDLPYFSFCSFKDDERNNKNFESTQFLMFDADHVTDLAALREKVIADPEVCLTFTSPSGDGLKFAVRLESPITDAAEYTNVYVATKAGFESRYGITLDDSTKDAARATFLSHGPDVYLNADSTPVSVATATNVPVPVDSKKALLEKALKGTTAGNRTGDMSKIVGNLIRLGADEETATAIMLGWNTSNTPPHTDEKITDTVTAMYKLYYEQLPQSYAERCKHFWSHSSEVFEFGINGGGFYMSKIGVRKFNVFVGVTDEAKAVAFQYLVDNKHISNLHRVNHIADVTTDETTYEVAQVEGSVTVRYAPIAAHVTDNEFIDTYLQSRFGPYTKFIKEYLAVFCYTNYRDLPTLVLKGARGSGKNTFAEMVYAIFPALSQTWEVKKGSFSPEVEKKLLIADETTTTNNEVYALLKQYSGSKHVLVNKKYAIPYEVENNMNIIIMSNSSSPISVEKSEQPTDESNNQFFVYDFKPFAGAFDADLDTKLKDRIGHYVRTELKTVFDGLEMAGNRYSIKVPITPEEIGLFESNTTEEESVAEKIVDLIADRMQKKSLGDAYTKLITDGLLPSKLIEEVGYGEKMKTQSIIKQLQKDKYIEMSGGTRVAVKTERYRCHTVTDKFRNAIISDIQPKPQAAIVPNLPDQCPLD